MSPTAARRSPAATSCLTLNGTFGAVAIWSIGRPKTHFGITYAPRRAARKTVSAENDASTAMSIAELPRMGNSAMDIAVEASFSAETVFLAARRGAYVMPKWVFGRPIDQIATAPKVPFKVKQLVAAGLLRAAVGDMERYGLPTPDHRILEAHPTVSDDVLSRIGHGEITPKPNIARLTERSVVFVDGSEERADVVVYCTGYKVSFPFFDPGFIAAPDNDLPLYRRVFHPDIDGVYFIALLQPLGATMPLAEAQSEWVCDHLTGRYRLPPRAEMLADIARERTAMKRRYVASKRHTMQVDYDDYMFDLKRERKRGASRASASLA